MDEEETVFKSLVSRHNDESQIYKQCKTLGLNERDVRNKVSNLSRGQKAKIGLVKLLLRGNDVLLFDELTNHLDINTIKVIEYALSEYRGAVVYTTHDKAFAGKVGYDRVIEL